MGKKILKRSLVIGLLMAFVITGNAWAEYNNYELPSGEFSSTSEVASNSTLDNGKNAIINSDYKLYSNPNAFSESKPNKLEMSGEIIYEGSNRLFNVYSGFAYNKSTVGEADNNLLIIRHDLTSNISSELYGAILAYEAKYDKNNYEKYDEFVDDLTISGNKVKIDSVTLKSTNDNQYFMVNAAIAQGAANNNIKAKENSIEIENVIFYTDNVWIAGAQSRGGASLEGNQVKIKNTDIEKGYIAGAVGQNNATLQINENVVTIDGTSKIGCDVYGGYNMSGTASGNSINIKGDADISKASLYGDNGGEGIGNTLNLETGWNGVVGSAENFNIINVGEGVEAIFKAPIVANEQNTVINICKDDGEDVDEEGVKESLLIGQIVTEETGSSSLNFINGGAWKVTGKSSVSDLQGDTINVDKVEENLVTITNGVKDNQKVVLNVTGDDIGVDVTTGVQTMVDTVVDGNGKSVFEKINDEEIDLKATVDAIVSEDGSVQNVTTSIKPGDKFVVESDMEVSGGLNAADDKFTVDSETGDVIANDVFANGGNGVLVGLRETAEKTEVNRVAIEAEVDRATKAEAALQEGIDDNTANLDALTKVVGAKDATGLKESYKENTKYITNAENMVEADKKLDEAIQKEEASRIEGDAILGGQIQSINQDISKLSGRVNKVGAGAAALAALHPLDFDPDDKLSFSAGVGNYGGETATALGAFYRPNEKVMISAAGTMGNGANMVNMGVSFALDKTNNVSNSRTAMAREIVDLRAHVARQEQALARQDQQIAQLVAMVNQLTGNTMSYEVNKDIIFPDVPENHWAYEYIHSLAAKGIIEGYPDGNFGGNCTMTRYEFATMLYKAMQKGAVLSEQIRQEFNEELGRIRVDRIKGADSDTNKIERVRVNADVDRDDYGSK